MKAEDTVMMPEQTRAKRKQLFPRGHKDCLECEEFVRRVQAEISFKAGEKKARNDILAKLKQPRSDTLLRAWFDGGKQQGIQEVVEILRKIGWDRAADDVEIYLGEPKEDVINVGNNNRKRQADNT